MVLEFPTFPSADRGRMKCMNGSKGSITLGRLAGFFGGVPVDPIKFFRGSRHEGF